MSLWSSFRRFSRANKNENSGTARLDSRSRSNNLQSLKHRDLRLEQFEQRLLLSITPNQSYLDDAFMDVEDAWDTATGMGVVVAVIDDGIDSGHSELETYRSDLSWDFMTETAVAGPQLATDNHGTAVAGILASTHNGTGTVDAISAGTYTTAGGSPTSAATIAPFVSPGLNNDFVIESPVALGAVNDVNVAIQYVAQSDDPPTAVWDGADTLTITLEPGITVVNDLIAIINNAQTSGSPLEASVYNDGSSPSGIAYNAELASYRLTSLDLNTPLDNTKISKALGHGLDVVDIYNVNLNQSVEMLDPGDDVVGTMRRGVTEGRSGLGSVYVYGAGDAGGNANYDALVKSRYSIAVGSAYDSDDDGVLDSVLSAPGSAVLVSGIAGPNGILTTDRTGADGYETGDYTSTDYEGFGGVQAAAAQISGVVALMLDANSALTYRDVQQILVESSSNWNSGAGTYDSDGLGWGTVNAQAAVEAAAGWDAYVAPEAVAGSGLNILNPIDNSPVPNPDGDPATHDTYIPASADIASDIGSIEWVEVTLYGLFEGMNPEHKDWGGNEIKLTSPSGVESYLTRPHTPTDDVSMDDGWTFTSAAHWGDASGGEWKLTLTNPESGIIGTWGAWDLKVYGQENAGGDTGPELVKIIPNQGGELVDGDVVDAAPRELILQFNSQQDIDPETLDAIQIVRSGGDDTFGDGNEQTIVPGYIAKGDQNNEVIIRFAETLPDDEYRLTIIGDEANSPLRNVDGVAFNGGSDTTIRFALDLGAQVLSVVPQPVYRGPLQVTATAIDATNDGDTFTVSDGFHEVTFEFNRSNDLLTGGVDNVTTGNIPIRFNVAGATASEVAGMISTAIQDDAITLGLLDSDLIEVTLNGAVVELSGRWAAISPVAALAFDVQTVQKLQQATDKVDVYFNDDDLDPLLAEDVSFYRLYNSGGTLYTPTEVFYDSVQDKAQLRFSGDLPADTYHLEIGASSDPATTTFVGTSDDTISSFEVAGHSAQNLGTLGSVSMTILGGDIDRAYAPEIQPGASDEPGHRVNPVESHLAGSPQDFAVYEYNFQDAYPQGAVPPWSTPNQIEENQKQRAREVFEIYAHYLGVEFRETDSSGLTVVTGDIRALNPAVPTGPGGVGGISDLSMTGTVIMDAAEDWGQSQYGGAWFETAMHEIGHSLGLGHTYDMPAKTIMGEWGSSDEPVFPGNVDLLHAQYLHPAASNEINLFKFEVTEEGRFTAETKAERDLNSALDTKLVLYREYDVLGEAVREVIASNDDYYSDDSFIGLELEAGTYYVGVMSTGMSDVDPTMENSGFGGTSEGNYELTLEFVPTPSTTLVDDTGTLFDGDADGVAGGTYDFWFHVGNHTHFVDKMDPADAGLGDDLITAGDSSLYTEIDDAIANAAAEDVIRVVGNDDDTPFLVGYSNTSTVLEDGALIQLPANVTMMVDAGAVFKLQAANLDIGSSAQGIDRGGSALQVLGTPMEQVHFRSFRDDSIGGDSDGASTGRAGGDWGGLVFRDDSDREGAEIYLNSVSFADIQHGGGEVLVDSVRGNYAAIHMIAARPTIAHNELRYNAGGAISADLTSFEEENDRIGPDIHGNTVLQNTIDGLFVRIETEFGQVVDHLTVPARWDDTDIVHVVTENLLIQGTPGGELNGVARLDARLRIDPATIVKLEGARIQAEIAGQLIAEGLPGYPVVFTSLRDDTYGMAGGFDTTNDGDTNPAYPGQWGGLVFSPTSKGALDYLFVAYAGGETSLGGEFEAFNTIEIHQADVRIANSYFTKNAEGGSTSNRDGLGTTEAATIFVRGAQPVILNNTFIDNNNIRFPNTEAIDDVGDIISIDVNSLTTSRVPDPGRSTGYADIFTEVADNLGPLVRYNRLYNNDVNSFAIRGGVLTTESVWDDTDIVHVVREEIEILNQHTFGGLRLQSSPTESLVVKLHGADTGFTANGRPLDIDDRIGGTLEIIGQPNNPVVLTSLNDLTIGAGFTPDGQSMKDTLNVGLILDAGGATPYVDVIVVIDESGSMGYVQEFTEQLIPQLDAALSAAGIGDGTLGDNRFGLVGFGGSDGSFFGGGNHLDAHSHLLNGNIWGTASEYVTAAQALVTNGAREDGWDGIQHALDGYDFRQDSTKFVILATDEPRYIVDPTVSYNSVLTSLQSEGVILEGILGVGIEDGVNQTALALDVDGTAFLEDGSGGFTTSPGGHFVNSWWPSIITDYANMAFATGGLVGDIYQISQGGDTTDSFAAAMISQILVQAGAGNPAGAGDWRSVQINEYANTRNVAVATEVEPSYLVDGGTNDTAIKAQVLGYLAPDLATDIDDDEKAGDENLRLGFEVHGHISMNDADDVDVYSFEAEPGTEVWIDIDRTSFGLDAMVELIQADDTWLARSTSNTSFVGNTDPSIINQVTPTKLLTDDWQGRDFYTNNSRDPAMHLVLPGTIGGPTQNYFLRVSSENGTSGEYEMQVRLRQVDEAAGSTVRYAEIRYATDGIEVNGQPGHSILSGEATETANSNNNWSDTSTQDLGNLLTSDRNTISVAGNLSGATDVDWYKFSLDYDLIQAIGGLSDGFKTWSTIFDIDYGDGLSRADMVLSVYDSSGNLILVSRDSNIEDDQPGAATGNDLDDLSRGSVGTFDPFIGSVQMPAGVIPVGSHREYYVAISSNLQLPSVLQANFTGNNTNSAALYRLEPVNSVQRVAEDHIDVDDWWSGTQGHTTGRFGYGGVWVPAEYSLFPDVNSAVSLSTNVVPYTFSDVVLFVSTNEGTDHLRTLNPFTGERVTDVGTLNGTHGVADIAMRGDGTLMAELEVDTGTRNDGNTGELRIVNTGNAGLSGGGNDDLPTDDDGAAPHYQDFAAMAFRDNGNGSWELYAVNNYRYDMATDPADVNDGQPALWEINQSDGSAVDENGNVTGRQPFAYLNGISGRVTGLEFDDSDGDRMYAVDDDGYLYHASFGSSTWTRVTNLNVQLGGATPSFSGLTFGPRNLDVLNNRDESPRDGIPDESPNGSPAVDDVLFASTASGEIYAFYTDGSLATVFDSGTDGIADTHFLNTGASSITGLAFSTLDYNLWHPTLNRRDDAGHGINEAFDLSRSNTTWLTNFNNGRTGSENEGGASFYFGMEPWVTDPDAGGSTSYFDDYWTGNNNAQLGLTEASHRDLNANSATHFTYDMPGGAYGELVTNSFSLANSDYEDKPTLYFNYFLETEETNVRGSAHDNMRDSARVFISNDGGDSWELVATNNSALTTNVATGELPMYLSTSAQPSLDVAPADRQQVQELHDNTGMWRQARVDLGNYAGDTNLMLRFDFSTAGVSPGNYDQAAGEDTDIWWFGQTFGDISDEERGQDNSYEGFYVDDIIIGYAERGEMVTRHSSVTSNPTSFYTVPQNPETGAPNEILEGDYQLEIRRGTEYGTPVDDTLGNIWVLNQHHTNTRMIPELGRLGDENLHREQDQLILEGNTIRDSVNYGISVDAGDRDLGLILPASHPGGVIKTPVPNNDALVPGVVIMNNVIAKSGQGGIFFSGDAGSPEAPVPFGRIVNNTIAGDEASRSAYGIQVTQNASPTILNNIITSANTAISIDSSSSSTVVGYNLFKDYGSIGTLGSHPIDMDLLIANDDDIEDLPLFVDPLNYNYYLASGALAIDSSLDVLGERSDFEAVKSSLSIPPSPIIAPEWDRYGQLRQDDPAQSPPSGMGASIFKDRGAVERADFTGPTAFLADPLDDQIPRVETAPKLDGQFDYNDAVTDVVVINRKTTDFAIQLQALEGIGLDDTSVNPLTAVTVYRVTNMSVFDDPVTFPRPLKQGATEDYVVRFDEINDVLHVIPTSGIWETGAYYVIRVNNSPAAGVQDQAGNPLQPTRSGGPFDGQAIFTAHLTGLDFGDLPDDPTTDLDYDTLLDSGTQGGARHVVTAGMYLGSPPSVELEGQPHATADADLYDDGVTITSALQLDGGHLTGEITVYASAEGYLNAWIDFNNDGKVDVANERIFLNHALTPGYNPLSIDITGVDGAMGADLSVERFARFRFTSESFTEYAWLDGAGEAGFEGLAYDGEVEDYLFEISEHRLDWGDAPTNLQTATPLYPTLSFQDGARHYITGPYLGNAAPDAELDGQPTALAAGDDADGNNDDDGVVFVGGTLVPGDYQSQVGLMVGNVAADAYVEAWIDFNGDGIWADEWATTGEINPDGDHDAFTITAERPGQEGTGIRVQFHEDTAFSVNYDGTNRILNVQFIPDTTTSKDIVDAINALGEPITADFVDAGPKTGLGRIQDLARPQGIPGGTIVPTTGGDFADPATTGVINPVDANNAFEIFSSIIDGSLNGPTVVFEHVANPGDRTTAVWEQGANTLTITFEPDVTSASDIVAKVNLSGAPLIAKLSDDPNLGEGVIGSTDSKIFNDAEYVLDGAYERILTNENVLESTVADPYQYVSFMVPADAIPGQTYARFRVTSTLATPASLLGVGGLADDGEVEDYAVNIERVDYGDAIDVYNTSLTRDTAGTLLSDGARHAIAGPWLGDAVDHDVVGAPSFWANGDDMEADLEPGDDEDGVVFSVPGATPQIVPGGPVGIDVTLNHDDFDGRASMAVDPSVVLLNDQFMVYAATYGTDLNGVDVQFDRMDAGLPHTGAGTIPLAENLPAANYSTSGGGGGGNAQTPLIDPVGSENAFRFVAKDPGTTYSGITIRFQHGPIAAAVWNDDLAPVDPKTLFVTFNPDDGSGAGATEVQELIAAVDAAGSPLELILEGDENALPVASYTAPTLTITYNVGATTAQIVDAINTQTALFTAELDMSNPANDGSDDVSVALNGYSDMLAGGVWPGYLNAWFDVNGDGVFQETTEERIFTAEPLALGVNSLSFDVPADTPVGYKYLRFRVTDNDGAVGPDGLEMNGEVEDYMVIVQRFDFGDAPDSYGTLLDSNGAHHIIKGPILGPIFDDLGAYAPDIDHDENGIPTVDADGDDNEVADPFVTTGGDDERGIDFVNGGLIPGHEATVGMMINDETVGVTSAVVEAWVDFNGDGVWTDEWATVTINPDGVDNEFSVTALDPGQVGTGTRVRFLADVAPSVVYDPADRILDVRYIPDTTTIGDVIDSINTAGLPVVAQLLGISDPSSVLSSSDTTVTDGAEFVLDGAYERIFTNLVVDESTLAEPFKYFDFMVPEYAVPGQTYARFRVSSNGAADDGSLLGSGGLALDGEVEDYTLTIQAVDYGDAPSQYPTLRDDDGARHVIDVSGPYLGAGVDHDPNGIPTVAADSDDYFDFNDDEDGVTFSSLLWIGATQKASYEVIAPEGGELDVWVDFNGDGIWDHSTEHLDHQTLAVSDAPQLFEFNVPDTGYAGETYVRVRITSDGKDAAGNPLTPTGLAIGGEVEDYRVYLNPTPVADAGGPYWINTNESLVLDGSGSTADDRVVPGSTDTIVLYEWDFTYDPSITDPTDERSSFNPEFTTTSAIDVLPWPWYQLINVPEPDAVDPLAIYLRVVDSLGAESQLSEAELRIFDNEPTATFDVSSQGIAPAPNGPAPYAPEEPLHFDGTGSEHDRDITPPAGADPALARQIVKYEWDLEGDGFYETVQNLGDANFGHVYGHTYEQFGQYTAVLRVTDNNVPTKTDVYSMAVNVTEGNEDPVAVPIPAADPYGYYTIDVGDALTLDGSESTTGEDPNWGDTIVSWQWDLNYDGVTFDADVTGETPEVPWHELDLLGLAPAAGQGSVSHTVALRVEDSFGNTHLDDNAMLYVHENRPHAVATSPVTPLSIAPGDAVTFNASSSWHDRDPNAVPVPDHSWPAADDNTIVSYEWDLHYDGTFDTEDVGAVVSNYEGYSQFGEYTAMVRVTDANGAYDMLQFDIIVDQNEDPPVPMTGGPYTVATGGDILLDASASYDPEDANHDDAGDAIVTYKWTLATPGGDLEIVTASPFYTLTWADHLNGLTAGEDYTLTLEVTDREIPGVITADTVAVDTLLSVRDDAVSVDLAVPSDPGLEVTRGVDVTFVATAENPYGTSIANYLWDFDYELGDFEADQSASGDTVDHAFTNFGTYSVAVIAEDTSGKWAMDVVQIVVNDGAANPVADAGSTHTHDVVGDAYFIDVGDDLYLNAENSSAGSQDADYGDSIQYFWDLDNDGVYDDATGMQPEVTSAQLDTLGMTAPGQYPIGLKVTDVFSESGGSADAFDTVPLFIFNNQPTAAIFTNPSVVNPISRTTEVTFDGRNSTNDRPDRDIVKYEWDFDGDGQFDGPNDVIQDDPGAADFGVVNNKTFPMFQVYNVTLRVTDNNTPGRTDADSITVTVSEGSEAPDAVLSVPALIETGQGITFDGSASTDPDALYGDAVVGYTWTIDGEELFDFADQPTITIPWNAPVGETSLTGLGLVDPTSVDVTLTVTDKLGKTDLAAATFGIYDNEPLPAFTATPNPVAYDVDVEFNASTSSHSWPDESAVSITKYEWDFNYDGEPANFDANATGIETDHSYSHFGDYDVALRVTDSNDKMAISVLTVEVSAGNHAPTAVAGGPYVFASGQTVVLDASASYDDDADHGDSIVSYAWDLDDDGLYELVVATPTTTITVDPQDVDKVLPIALRVMDSQGGLFGYDTTTLEVVTNVPPTANAGGPYTLTEGTPFQLDGTGSQDDGLIISYEWDLDYDGTTFNVDREGAQPTITFGDDMASQTIALRVKDAGDKTDIHATTLTVVNADPVASIDTLPTDTLEGQTVTLTGLADDLGEEDTHTFDWTITLAGNQVATGSDKDISFVPLENGDYELTLTVTDDDGGDHTVTDTLTVNNADPAAGNVTVTPTITINGETLIANGQEVTVSGTFTDPGTLDTHTVSINWGDGTTTDATVDQAAGTYEASHTFAAGGEYTIVSTVTDDENASDQASATANAVNDLGVVDFRDDLTDLDPSSFSKGIWFVLTTAHNGLLTVELGGTGATFANVTLFDTTTRMPVDPLPNGPSDGDDFLVPAGNRFYLWLTGTADDVDLRLTNLVSVDASAVTVAGTDLDDAFEFELTDSYLVRINGTQYHFADGPGVPETVSFDGGLGDDTATFTGSAADESARFFTGSGEFYSGSELYDETGFFVDAAAEHLIAHSEGGRDFVKMYDSPGDDLFTASPREASLVGPGYSHAGHGFYVGLGYATNREGDDTTGGNDQAILDDSAGNDKFKLDWADAKQFFGKLYGGNYYSRAKNFETIDANATDGSDLAVVLGSPVDDEFYLKQGVGHVTTQRTDVDFLGFDTVVAYAGDGYDIARFEDSAGADDFRGRSHKSTMTGSGYELTARRFEKVYAEAKNGGNDRAKLHDTSLDNILHAEERSGQTWAQMAIDGTVEDPLYEVLAFEFVKAYATEGEDKVDRTEEFDWLFLDGDWTDE